MYANQYEKTCRCMGDYLQTCIAYSMHRLTKLFETDIKHVSNNYIFDELMFANMWTRVLL